MRTWLRSRFESASTEDRLDIARHLGDPDLFRSARPHGGKPFPALVQARVRAAALRCCEGPDDLPDLAPDDLDHDHLVDELSSSPQLAAYYIETLVAFANDDRFRGHALGDLDGQGLDCAVTTLAEVGALRQIGTQAGKASLAEEISAEARALLAYFSLSNENTLLIRPSGTDLPFSAVQAVLREAERAREDEERIRKQLRPVQHVRQVLGFAALVLAVQAAVVAGALSALDVIDLVSITGRTATAFVVVFLVLAFLLIREQLFPDRLRRLADWISDGVFARLRRIVGSGSGER